MHLPTKIYILAVLLFMSNTIISNSKSSDNRRNMVQTLEKKLPIESSREEKSGIEVYKKYCLSCHQANGSGVPGLIPPLGTGSWIGKNPDDLIVLILKGLKGEIEVNGDLYRNVMPLQPNITDQELADVLTFVRSNFGNNFTPVTQQMVSKVRSKQ